MLYSDNGAGYKVFWNNLFQKIDFHLINNNVTAMICMRTQSGLFGCNLINFTK